MSIATEHYTASAEEAHAVWFLGNLATIRATGERTNGQLAVVEFLAPPGFATPRHVHHGEDEAFYVVEGALDGFFGERQWRADPGSFVWLPRDTAHGFRVEGDQPARILTLALPAGFDQFVSEVGERAPSRTLPPPAEPDVGRLLEVAARYRMEILGPPGE